MRLLLYTTLAAIVPVAANAQSYQDLVDSRNPAQAYASLFQIELGAIGSNAQGSGFDNLGRGLDDEISWDGRVYYRDEDFSGRSGSLEAYAGRDGLFAGFTDGKLVGDDTLTRFEVHARPWQFYRDGYYRGNRLLQNGFFEGSDYEGYVGFGRMANDGLYVEFGPYYRSLSFSRSDLTPVTYTLPNDYAAYGIRMFVEQRAVQMDRRHGVPLQGSVLTIIGEREWNDSDAPFGTPQYSTRLASAYWRARGRLEWYIPGNDALTWEVFVHGGWHDQRDRLQNIEAQRPLGYQWGDGQLRLRMYWADAWTVTPFLHVQYSRVVKDDGYGSTKDFFLGGGVETWMHFSESFSINGWYSYMNNENRPSVRIDRDVHGEHMFYLGMVLRFGAQRR